MESPVKKLELQSEANKENLDERYASDELAIPIKGIPEMPEEPEQAAEPSVVSTLNEEEAKEPILQENPQRFVLFPIKYHEVWTFSRASRRDKHANPATIDLANVQESRGIFLDS